MELWADCPSCKLESGVVEIYDPLVAACRFGLPATTRCKLCAVATEGTLDRPASQALADVAANACPVCLAELAPSALDDRRCAKCGVTATMRDVALPSTMATEEHFHAALDAWAARDGFASRQALLDGVFCEPDANVLFGHLRAGNVLAVVADPFANLGARAASSTNVIAAGRAEDSVSPPSSHGPRSAPPRAIVYPLVSVIAADGEIHPREREIVDRFLLSEGLATLADDEFRVHHPSEVAHLVPHHRRETVVQLMCETAAADGMPDESERRVIRAYASAWDVPDEKVDFWMWGYENMSTGIVRQLWLKIRRFVLSARWSKEGSEGR